jgi:uncharacterized RDD family membrane protein YckC
VTWQSGGGAGSPDQPAGDETQVDWTPSPQGPVPLPPAPPPAPAAPSAGGAGGYTYPAETASQPALPVEPPAPVYPAAPGGSVPPGGTWQPPQAFVPQPGSLKFGGVLPRLLAYWLDSFIVSIVVALIGGLLGAMAGSAGFDSFVITTVLSVGTYALYFIGFWTSGGRATPGMRLFHLQVGQAADGRDLTMGQAVVRWAALGYPVTLLTVVPWLVLPVSSLLFLWEVVLLASTALSPTRQGLHDRVAGSAIVAPEGNEGPVIPCLVLAVILLVVLPILAIVALIAIGTQVEQILNEVSGSI